VNANAYPIAARDGYRPMILSPTTMQCVALALSIAFPILLLGLAQFRSITGAGTRFGLGCITSAVIFLAMSILLPGGRDPADVFSGALLLATAMLFWNVIWSLLAFGFTLTLLTALAREGRPVNRNQWISAYMQGSDLEKFARNRLQLLLGTGMARADDQNIVATSFGIATAVLIRTIRFVLGIR
jgi:hypothetical protein